MTDETKKEIESLRNHNSELLAELKQAKAAAKELQAQITALTGERDLARADYKRVQRDTPLSEMSARLAAKGAAVAFQRELESEFDFVMDGDKLTIKTKAGELAQVRDEKGLRPARFDEGDLRELCRASENRVVLEALTPRATGTGARSGGEPPVYPVRNPESKPAMPAFGLR
ncbi:MAG: hypothetical protein QM741_13655 [Rudaea sp.]|uniref:hypothetical protein n=1 Tax=Rudaea sp. TaxID=2136325 RepID=UPI0039E4AD49